MSVQQNRKIFFWVFGLIFSIFLYFGLSKYTSNSVFVVLSISLIIIILFFFIGEIMSHFSGFCVYCLKQKSSSEILDFAKQEFTKEKKREIINKIKCALNSAISQNYSEESINQLNKYVGINIEETRKLIALTKKLIAIKWVYWILGLCFSISNVFLIFYIDYFSFLRYPVYVPLGVNLIIFLLFYIEGILVMRVPESVYFKILNIQEEKQKKHQDTKVDNNQKSKIKEEKQKETIESIKVSIGYLLKMKVPKEMLEKILIEQGFSVNVSKQIISDLDSNVSIKEKTLPVKRHGATEKLFLNKIYEDFSSLKSISSELSELKENMNTLSEKQKEIDNFSERITDLENKIKDLNVSDKLQGKTQNHKVMKKDNVKSEVSRSKEQGYKFSTEVNFLYNLILPQASKYRKEDIQSFLLYQNYNLETVEDLMELFKQNNVKFKEDDQENKIISFINRVFAKK